MVHDDPVLGAVGPRLRALRRQRGATLAGLSELTGVSVLWSIFAIGLMLVGVWKRRKVYRISAISLLIATVLKVLAFDTAEVSTPYRILSCLVLGIILMVVSFLYYRFSERLIK